MRSFKPEPVRVTKRAARPCDSAKLKPASPPMTVSAVAQASACMASAAITVTAAGACCTGCPVRGSFQRDDACRIFLVAYILWVRRGFHQYLPRAVVGLAAIAVQFTAHFHQRSRYAFGTQMACHQIHGITLGDGRQIKLETARLPSATR